MNKPKAIKGTHYDFAQCCIFLFGTHEPHEMYWYVRDNKDNRTDLLTITTSDIGYAEEDENNELAEQIREVLKAFGGRSRTVTLKQED